MRSLREGVSYRGRLLRVWTPAEKVPCASSQILVHWVKTHSDEEVSEAIKGLVEISVWSVEGS